MNQETPAPWVEVDADDGTFSLYGNTGGFTALRKAIDVLLGGEADEVRMDLRPGGIESIALADDTNAGMGSRTRAIARLMGCLLLSIPACILLLAIFGLIQLYHLLSNP